MKTPYDKLAKMYTKYFAHMTKMATMPIYGKTLKQIFSSRTRWPLTLGLICSIGDVGPSKFSSNDDSKLTFTYFTSRSNLLPNAFKWEIL